MTVCRQKTLLGYPTLTNRRTCKYDVFNVTDILFVFHIMGNNNVHCRILSVSFVRSMLNVVLLCLALYALLWLIFMRFIWEMSRLLLKWSFYRINGFLQGIAFFCMIFAAVPSWISFYVAIMSQVYIMLFTEEVGCDLMICPLQQGGSLRYIDNLKVFSCEWKKRYKRNGY